MPNWVHNTLTVLGDRPQLQRFAEQVAADGRPLSLETLAPTPPEMLTRELDPQHSIERLMRLSELSDKEMDWYLWRLRHWGTKWDTNFDGPHAVVSFGDAEPTAPAGLLIVDDSYHYHFLTAGGPPVPAIDLAAARFDQLAFKLRFAEVGADIAGEVCWQHGAITEETELAVADVLAPEDQWF